jgi:hypothetical protein
MFQGAGTNPKAWNEGTESKFLDRLKTLGNVYTYQDITNNIPYYAREKSSRLDYDPDINFDFKYVNVETHIEMVYNDIKKKYKDFDDYKIIPVGWSIGGLMALYFAQKYKSKCVHVMLLDPSMWTPKNQKQRLEQLDNPGIDNASISNATFKKMLNKLKSDETTTMADVIVVGKLILYKRQLFMFKHLRLKLPVPTTSFVNIDTKDEEGNKMKLIDIETLKTHNPTTFNKVVFVDKGHMVFRETQPAEKIIKCISDCIKLITV